MAETKVEHIYARSCSYFGRTESGYKLWNTDQRMGVTADALAGIGYLLARIEGSNFEFVLLAH